MRGTTAKQADILAYIVRYVREYGYPPSYRDIQTYFGFGTSRAVETHLGFLEKKGLIECTPGTSRAIVVTARGERESGVERLPSGLPPGVEYFVHDGGWKFRRLEV